MELDINNLCNALNILVKPADKGVYREKLGTVLILVPIYTGWMPFAMIRIACRKTMVCSVAPKVCCFQHALTIEIVWECVLLVWTLYCMALCTVRHNSRWV